MDNAGVAWELPWGVRSAVVGLVVSLVMLVAAVARADDATAESLFDRAQAGERDFEFARALADYEASFAASPSSRYAQRAMNRVAWLKARAEGGFAPLARLERVRRDPAQSNDPNAIDALARDAEKFPPGLVRVEARMLAGDAYVGRMNRHAEGIALLRLVVDDPNSDPLTSRQAAKLVVATMADDGDIDHARSTAHALQTKLDPAFVTSIDRRVRRRAFHRAAIVDLAAFAVLVAASIALAKRRERLDAVVSALRSSAPIAIAFAAYVALAGGVLASSYEAGNAKPFLVFGATTMPLVLAARAWGASGSPRAAARAARAIACASAAIASAFMVLEQIDPAYLEGFGL